MEDLVYRLYANGELIWEGPDPSVAPAIPGSYIIAYCWWCNVPEGDCECEGSKSEE